MRKLYIIAGCNGAGKTTASYTMLPELLHCHEFVNADEIARGLSGCFKRMPSQQNTLSLQNIIRFRSSPPKDLPSSKK